jgi:hypothetical protein
MIHYSCDRCKRPLDADTELRYEVRLEVRAVMDCDGARRPDEDRDHLLDLQEILARQEDLEDDQMGEDVYQRESYDLCPACYRKFMKNPLGRELAPQLNFSKN